MIAERTAEGRDRARRAGRRLGRPPKLSQFQRDVVLKMRREGQDNAEIARPFGVQGLFGPASPVARLSNGERIKLMARKVIALLSKRGRLQ